jgi:hypothetical protein
VSTRARLLICLLVALAFTGVAKARAAEVPNALYDQVATEVAGHPVHAWCENDPVAWRAMETAVGYGPTEEADGYTYPPDFTAYAPVVFIAPAPCAALTGLETGQPPFDAWATARGIRTLLHESVHQRGGIFDTDPAGTFLYEGRTDCEAVRLMPTYVPRFGIAPTVTTVVVTHHRKRVHKHWRRWTTTQTVVQPNPLYDEVLKDAQLQHDSVAKSAPQYKGDC